MEDREQKKVAKVQRKVKEAPATSTAVERLFSAASLILDAKRSKLDPAWVDHILFLREAFLLGTCKLDWE